MSPIPLPALQVQSPQIESPIQQLGQVSALKNAQQQQQIGQQTIQENQLKLQQQQQDQQDSETIKQAYGQAGGDLEKLLPMVAGKVSAKATMSIQNTIMERRQKLGTMDETKLKNVIAQSKLIGDRSQAILGLPPEQRPAAVQQSMAEFTQQGVMKPEEAQQMVQQIPQDPAGLEQWLKVHGMGAMDAAKQAENVLNQQREKREGAAQQETGRHNLSTEAQAAKTAFETARHNRAEEFQAKQKTGTDAEIEAAASQLADPKNLTALKDITSFRGDQRLRIFARAKEINPNFDPGLTNQRVKFLQEYEDPKGRAATNRQAINNVLQHAGDLSDLNQQYRRADVRILNTPLNAIARQFGNDAYTRFSTTNSVLKDELSLYFAGGYSPSSDQQKMWNKIQSDEATPAQTEAFAKEVVHLGLRRATTFNSQFEKNMGYQDPNMIIPEAKNAAEKLGMGNEVARFGSGGGYSKGQAQQQAGPSGKTLSMSIIEKAAKDHGISVDEAKRQAQAAGYAIQ